MSIFWRVIFINHFVHENLLFKAQHERKKEYACNIIFNGPFSRLLSFFHLIFLHQLKKNNTMLWKQTLVIEKLYILSVQINREERDLKIQS